MNEAVNLANDGLLTTADLAGRPDFALGLAAVSPSSRTIAGPGGTADLEPRVMQVLVVLADAAGQVVTRGTLFDRCWGGVFVSDDSLNRTIAAIRKLAAEIAGGSFEIETIPRTGYRLNGKVERPGEPTSPPAGLSRRGLIAASGATAVVAAGAGLWWSAKTRDDKRFQTLLGQASDQIDKETADDRTVQALERAIAMRPDSADAWGLLALLKSYLAPNAPPPDAARLVDESEKAARRALSLDSRQPDALLAMFELQGSTLDWIARDRALRQIVAIDPRHVRAMSELTLLTAATGLIRESWDWNERVLAIEPLSSHALGFRALKLWVFGRTSEADKVADQLRGLYPDDPWVWFVRLQIYAFTGRASAALRLLDSEPAMEGRSPMATLWRATLPALDDPSPAKAAKAREACLRAAATSGMVANEAVLIMSALGDIDTAFEIAEGWLLSRGPLGPRERPGTREASENAGWRVSTQWMWVPPIAAMRADPRFLPMCREIGLARYWQERGVKPDYMRAPAPPPGQP